MSKYLNTWLLHDSNRERLKKEIGKVKKIHFTQEEALEVLDSGDLTPLYDAFSTFIFKEANRLAIGDAQGALSLYTEEFFMDIYQEGQMFLTLALQRYDKTKNDNVIGYCMAYVKGGMLQFKKRYLEGPFSNKSQYRTKDNREKEGWVKVDNFGSYDDVTEKYDKIIEKTYGVDDSFDNYEVYEYIINNNHIFKLSVYEMEVFKLYFGPDELNTREIGDLLKKDTNCITSTYSNAKRKIKKHKRKITRTLYGI
jgi:DNA-directed RNA polymerase specialized sigma subunit